MPRGAQSRQRRTERRTATTTETGFEQITADLLAAATGNTGLPLSDRDTTWDASAADKRVREWAGATEKPNAKYASAFFWKDSAGGDKFGDYKLGFGDVVDGKLVAVWKGITAVAGALQGARGGVQIPDADKSAIKGKVEGYYSKAAKKYNDDSITVPWKGDSASIAEIALALAQAELGGAVAATRFYNAVNEWTAAFEDCGCDDPDEFASKTAECADCGHPAGMHSQNDDGEYTGGCMANGCDCDAFAAKSSSESDEETLDMTEVAEAITEMVVDMVTTRLEQFQVTFADAIETTLPDAHKPGARLPRRRSGPKAPASTLPSAASATWDAVFAPEGKLTDDGRAFAPGSITWRELPLTLMAMIETSEGGHVGAEVCGRIDKIWRDEQAGLIRASGIFDTGDYGQEIARLVADSTLRGVSVDLAIHSYDVGPRSDWFDEDGNWAPKEAEQATEEPNLLDILFGGGEDQIMVVTDAVIGMTTVCPFPAFAEGKIEVGNSLVSGANPAIHTYTGNAGWRVEPVKATGEALTASALAIEETAGEVGEAPMEPPAEWFADPGLEGPTAVTVDEEGRVFGHAATWGTCHTAFPDICVEAPNSEHDYAYFHLGEVVCEGGERLSCGQITLDTGHADHGLGRAAATEHYDHTGYAVADVKCGEDEFGIWVAGAIRPDITAASARKLRGAKLSGDWRDVNGNLELIALLAVNVPGFPVPRPTARVASAGLDTDHVVSLVAAGIPIFAEDIPEDQRERFEELRAAQQQLQELADQAKAA